MKGRKEEKEEDRKIDGWIDREKDRARRRKIVMEMMRMSG